MKPTTQRTLSILQRLPVILAVTAASYGLAQPQPGTRSQAHSSQASGQHGPLAGQPLRALPR
ncbi:MULTISPECIES: hypothetical protein [Ramlibacter]|uniref:Uncharacterized protein n=1 Tax=Ramlibacter aquaticus TaxID=2780094 RepID=A0ABR9SCK0_9BURK|nr:MULTISPECIES: hypothetical protein [Ramlibacter]MBE7940071.1 hypothetical protein [Ramlibacter aquaticus]